LKGRAGRNDAAASATAGTTSVLHWFVSGGDTYIVQDNSNSATFVNGPRERDRRRDHHLGPTTS
jgi:hypothetical protein